MQHPPRRVGGFLLFFCVYLTIIVPLGVVAVVALTYPDARVAFDAFPRFFEVTMLSFALYLAVAAGSFVAGYRLWTLHPQAVQTAKIFLVLAFLIGIVTTYLPLAAELPAETTEEILTSGPMDVLRGLATMVFWIIYLNKSDRVKETYAAAAQ